MYIIKLLRHCATSRKFAGSIPDGVTGIFHWYTGRTVALGLTSLLNLLEPYGPVQACNGIALPSRLCISFDDNSIV
jgi:hypothetical protein